ncbi:MAG TPA: bifunctional DNA primase/polymerase, partial [Acidimicrobiales bacterium]|nr:bifunctional DNA primase/polymerase [Acidimicrobiales bacterium]
MTGLDQALELAERFHVFPVDHPLAGDYCQGIKTRDHDPRSCTERGKHPMCKWSEWSTQDPDRLAAAHYFGGPNPCNIGIDCGKSGVVVLDEDAEGEFDRICADLGVNVPVTFTVRTGKGRHFYFRQPAAFGNAEGALRGYKVNVRGVGGYVVGPGSLHATGVVYETILDVALAELPDWLAEALNGKPSSTATVSDDTERGWWRAGPIPEGNRHHAIVAAAGWCLGAGMTMAEAEPTVRDTWSRCEGDKYTWEQARGRLEDIYGRYEAGNRLAERRERAQVTVIDEGADVLAGLRNGAWLDAQEFPPLRYHLPGIIPEGSSLLVGPPKIGKSWFVLSLGLAAAAGGTALGLPVDPRPVLYLALEDGHRRLQSRCRILLDTDRIPDAFDYLVTVQPGTIAATIEAWLARHPDAHPLVILDTLGKVMPPAVMGETTYQRDYRVGGTLKRLVDEQPGSALVTNHHDRKASAEDFVDRVSGSNGLAGSADTIIVLARARHDTTGRLEVTGRDVSEGEYAVQFDGPRGLWSLDGGNLDTAATAARQRRVTEGLDERSRAVIDYVTEHPEGVRWGDVKRDLGEEEARYLSRLHESGRIARPSRGRYQPLSVVSVVSGFTDLATTGRGVVSGLSSGNGQTDTTDTLAVGARCRTCGGPEHPDTLHKYQPS